MTGREAILKYGKEMFGDNFNLDSDEIGLIYKGIYNYFIKSATNKTRKSLMIIGNVGAGKGSAMKVMQRIFKDTPARFKWISSSKLKDLSETLPTIEIKEMYGYDLKMDLYIDDIGIYSDVKRYGTTINIISEILLERYELFVDTGIKTHFSSNLLPDSTNPKIPTIKSIYGTRVFDRLKEQSITVLFKGESLRK